MESEVSMGERRMLEIMLCSIVGLFLVMFSCDTRIFAAEVSVSEDVCELIVEYQYEGSALADVQFTLYYVADVDADGYFEPEGPFASYPVALDNQEGMVWKSEAVTMECYLKQDLLSGKQVEIADCGRTDREGRAVFPNQSELLKPGIYLVTGQLYADEEHLYSCEPVLICLPFKNGEERMKDAPMILIPKVLREKKSVEKKTTVYSVKKIWEDSGKEEYRPKSVEMILLYGNRVFDTVCVNADNDWKYQWEGDGESSMWSVVESKPENYLVAITREQNEFTVRNYLLESEENNVTAVKSESEETVPFQLLPQTGTTWWIVVMFAGTGLLFLILDNDRNKK